MDDIIEVVTKDQNSKYSSIEVQVSVYQLLEDCDLRKIKDIYILNAGDWITDTINKYHKYLSNEDILFLLSGEIKCYINDDIGRVIKQRVYNSTARDIDIVSLNNQLLELIKTKKIEL